MQCGYIIENSDDEYEFIKYDTPSDYKKEKSKEQYYSYNDLEGD